MGSHLYSVFSVDYGRSIVVNYTGPHLLPCSTFHRGRLNIGVVIVYYLLEIVFQKYEYLTHLGGSVSQRAKVSSSV